jgi:hypothetical protein
MIKLLVLLLGISIIVLGVIYIIRQLFKLQKGTITSQDINKKGLLAAIGAIILGAFLVYKNTNKGK